MLTNDIDPVLTPCLPSIGIEQTPSIEIPEKRFKTTLDRDNFILEQYSKGWTLMEVAKEVGLSEMRISQIVRANKDKLVINREFEKNRRYNRLKRAELKASPTIAPKDATELVRVIEAQRKELEGDLSGPSITNNTQIIINNVEVNAMTPNQQLDLIRNLIG